MRASSLLGVLGALLLSVALLVGGFAACCAPVTTSTLASLVSWGDYSPYTHEQLVPLAEATRDVTVDYHRDAAAARKELAQDVVDAARAASGERSPKSLLWLTPAKDVLASAGDDPVATMDALAQVSDRYALDADAVSHLEDCNRLISAAVPWLIGIVAAAVGLALILAACGKLRALALMLRLGPAVLVAALLVLAVWGFVDFNGLFAVFHSLFFVDGTWTFNYDSLLISMYPIDFWMGMGGVWVVTSLALSVLCFILGFVAARRARKRDETA